MAFTESGMEYGVIDEMLATSQTTRPQSRRLKKLRKDLIKEQIGERNDIASEATHQARRVEGISDYAEKLKLQDSIKKDQEERKRRMTQAGIAPKMFSY